MLKRRKTDTVQIHLDRNRDQNKLDEVRGGQFLAAAGSNGHDMVAGQFARCADCAPGLRAAVGNGKAGGAGEGGRVRLTLTPGRQASRQ